MSGFDALVKFVAKEDRKSYFAHATYQNDAKSGAQLVGTTVTAFTSVDDLRSRSGGRDRTIEKVRIAFVHREPHQLTLDVQLLAPLPSTALPIYCVGLNYTSHAEEAKVRVARMGIEKA